MINTLKQRSPCENLLNNADECVQFIQLVMMMVNDNRHIEAEVWEIKCALNGDDD